MEQKIVEQISYLSVIMTEIFSQGPNVWNFNNSDSITTDVFVGGRYLNTDELSDMAIDAKRKGQYVDSIGTYCKILMTYRLKTGKIPSFIMKGIFKTLISANYFKLAFDILGTFLSDMQNNSSANTFEKKIYENYFLELTNLAIEVVDNERYCLIEPYAGNYSGNPCYRLFKSLFDTNKELLQVRDTIRDIYRM